MNRWFYLLGLSMSLIVLNACRDRVPNFKRNTPTSGTIHVSADESFKPVIDSQIQVFESLNPQAKIDIQYKPEAECIRDLNNDSIAMVIITRGLSPGEEKILTDTLQFKPGFGPLAWDAVAVIVNTHSKDTTFTIQDIRSLAKGTSNMKYKLLLDGTSATSTVRFLKDSVLRGDTLSANVVAAQNSQGVIDHISNNDDAIGLIGVSWVGNRDDPQVLSFLEKVRVASIECNGCNGTFVRPYQANIVNGRYPMVRPLYYILKENYNGLGSGFRNFLIYERGQLIFQRAYLLPARMKFEVRQMSISDSE
jgi:phosphate transport system substrate-binding protein